MLWVLGRKLLVSLLKRYSWCHIAQVSLHMNVSKFGREREIFFSFITSEREKLGCLISHLRLLGVEAGLSGYGLGFCSVRKEPLCSFQQVI